MANDMTDDLASGFRDVDGAADVDVFADCLTLIDSLPFFSECKRASYDLLEVSAGSRILDVGCGLGDDAASVATRVEPGGAVVGLDGSRSMIAKAEQRHGRVDGLTFTVGDAARLPFDAATFDACRIDRVLQHLPDPAAAIAELARVVRPGGTVVAFDNDWETLTVDSLHHALTRTIANAWCDRFPSGWIGRQMVPLFLRSGLRDVVAHPMTLVLRDLDIADRVFAFSSTTAGLIDAGVINADAAARWWADLRSANDVGEFFTSYTGFLVSGKRPKDLGNG